MTKKRLILFAMISVATAMFIAPQTAQANMSYTPYIHEVILNGEDMEITVSVFEETEASSSLQGLEAEFTLKGRRIAPYGVSIVFQDHTFQAEDADEVTGKVCHSWGEDTDNINGTECEENSECTQGFCAVAYRFKVIEHCPLYRENTFYSGDFWYTISTSTVELGEYNWVQVEDEIGTLCDFDMAWNGDEEDTDDNDNDNEDTDEDEDTDDNEGAEDQVGDSDCAVSKVGMVNGSVSLFRVLLSLI